MAWVLMGNHNHLDTVLRLLRHGFPGGTYEDMRRQFREALGDAALGDAALEVMPPFRRSATGNPAHPHAH